MITYTNNWGIYITEHLNPPGELPEFLSCVRVEFYKHETWTNISAFYQKHNINITQFILNFKPNKIFLGALSIT